MSNIIDAIINLVNYKNKMLIELHILYHLNFLKLLMMVITKLSLKEEMQINLNTKNLKENQII